MATPNGAKDRLHETLEAMGYTSERRAWQRATMIAGVRSQAIADGDQELLAACEAKLLEIPSVRLIDGKLVSSQSMRARALEQQDRRR